MNDFDYDIVQKKRIARSAAKKKIGSKSKKCTLPSDSLTAAERKKLNGECKVYDWSKPISWKEFKKYPHDIQEECLLHFAEKWGCSSGMFVEMVGTQKSTWGSYQNNNDLSGILLRGATNSARAAFKEWLDSFRDGESKPKAEAAPVEVKTVEKEVLKIQTLPLFVHTLNKGNFTMSGIGNEIAQTLSSIFQNARVEMRVDFRVLPEEEPQEEEKEWAEE